MTAALVIAGALEVFGVVLFWRESRVAGQLDSAFPEDQAFLRRRIRRRVRIAVLVCLLGILMGIGGWAPPNDRPLLFVGSWTAALCVTLLLLCVAAYDLFSVRLHWSEQTQRTLADIAQKQAELRAWQKSPEEDSARRRLGPGL